MMIVQLPIPVDRSELSLHRVGSWDQEALNPLSCLHRNSSLESSLCPYAVAFGSFVYGIRQVWKEGETWLTWKTSFAPYRVCGITSNRDGSIIACSTDAETVALLRGMDGAVLATRKVANGEAGEVRAGAYASFIARNPTNESADQGADTVVIRVPSAATPDKTTFMLVSNIEAKNLNTKNPIKFAESARKMTVNDSLEFISGDSRGIESLCGCFLRGGKRIRFFSLNHRGKIACHDYAGPDAPMQPISDSLKWKNTMHRLSTVDLSIGPRIHERYHGAIYVMFATESNVFFLDPIELSIAGSCSISSVLPSAPTGSKILSIEPIESSMPQSSVAAAVVLKPKGEEGATIGIIEAVAKDSKLGEFHQVYMIPIKGMLVSLAFTPSQYRNQGSYSFRFKVGHESENFACKAFVSSNDSHDGTALGKIRLLIQSECFDEADLLINKIGETALISDKFAYFHPSEVALGRLRQILNQGNVSAKASMTQARQCFHRLSSGSIAGSEAAQHSLLSAADAIVEWASPGASPKPPTLIEVTAALSTVSKVLGEVSKLLPSDRHSLFLQKQIQLNDHLATARYLLNVLPKQPEEKLQHARHFQGSRSPGELFFESHCKWLLFCC